MGLTSTAPRPASLPSSLVAIRRGGTGPPLFCVHAQEGSVRLFHALAEHLDDDQPVYGLRAVPSAAGTPYLRFEEMAERYRQEILAHQPRGPYVIAGECLGGGLAYELARQLRAGGSDVALLVLIDAFAPGRPRRRRLVSARAYAAVHRLRVMGFHARNVILGRGEGRVSYILVRVRRTVRRRLSAASRSRACPSAMNRCFADAARAYTPERYDGPVAVFRAASLPWGIHRERDLGWGRHARQLEVVLLPAYFTTLISEPPVGALASELQARIRTA